MANNKLGGQKARDTNKAKYGDDFYQRIGAKGGSAYKTKPSGFASMDKKRLIEVSSIGGKISKRKPVDK